LVQTVMFAKSVSICDSGHNSQRLSCLAG
jgi:hypothetical protein